MRSVLLIVITLVSVVSGCAAVAFAQGAADPWPRQLHDSGRTVTVYEPQVDSWDGGFLKMRAAVSVKPDGGTEVFGIVRASAHTLVDKSTRMVTLFNFSLLQIDFPTLPDHGQAYYADIGKFLPTGTKQISLERLQSFLTVEKVTPKTVAVKNQAPQIIVSYTPAVLIPIHGAPVREKIAGSDLSRVVNTRALLVFDPAGRVFLHVYDGWMSGPGLSGPWQLAGNIPQGLDQMAESLAKAGKADLLRGDPKSKLSLATTVPAIYVAEGPAEIIVFQGQPQFEPVGNTQLLWVTNSSGDVIMDASDNHYYVLISGRWFRSPALNGPWSYVASNDLPADFRKIPPGAHAGEVLTAVAGTPQAQEAVIANSVPQTALIPRSGGPTFTPTLDGAPQYRPIEGTALTYVWNSPDAIIAVDSTTWYALSKGVWFTSRSLAGPWVIAVGVPDVIYTIPSSSPLHYVTYVNVYWASPDAVEIGYTPGYLGTVVADDGVVVYGTGYDYPAWVGTAYYPPPPTYGYGAYPAYDVATGAMFGFALGLATAAIVAPAPYWGPTYYNNYYTNNYYHGGGCCWGGENVYGQYGATTYNGYKGYGYNPYTGNVGTEGQYHTYNAATGTSQNVQTYHGYNAYTGTEGAGYNRQAYNQYTGNSADVSRNAAYNPETGGWEKQGSATGYNNQTGSSASVQHTSEGNVYGGGTAGETTATVTNGKTGQTNTYEAGHMGNNVYAGSDGNVYKNSGNGWQKATSSGWQSAGGENSDLNRYSQSRSTGDSRYNSFSSRGFYQPSMGGGGFGGGGGFRRRL